MKKVEAIAIDGIEVRAEHRAPDQTVVAGLVESLRKVGLLNPILVREPEDDSSLAVLISGRHRLEAAKVLGWDFIDGCFFQCESDDDARGMSRSMLN